MKDKFTKGKLTILIGSILTVLLLNMLNTYGLPHVIAEEHGQSEKQSVKKELNNTEGQPSHQEIVELTSRFMDLLVQDIDKQYKVINYRTKEQLLQEFENVTDRQTAKPYVDYYYTEKADGLYLLPTETPRWFSEKNSYDMVQLEDDRVKVIQENDSVLYGNYQIEIEFTLKENEWLITDVTHF
ncbi:hypothetical protein ACFOGI_03860 [Virgibacillus xinjiangensis]|uniref:DUF3993 domain-containing protein n=1 Tax=Virgibacillus xinjiangensis TaxID=393090 RepID=A0ABV7CSZ4_9BACI